MVFSRYIRVVLCIKHMDYKTTGYDWDFTLKKKKKQN